MRSTQPARVRLSLVAAIALSLCPAGRAQAQAFLPGDINADQSVNVLDATVLRRALSLQPPGISQTCQPTCGNGVADPGEQCELGTLGGQTCSTLGLPAGTLGCTPGTCLFNTVGCTGGFCSPVTPAPLCGANTHCTPVPTGAAFCSGPAGAGSQGSACGSDASCLPAFACINAGGPSNVCLRWCVVGMVGACTPPTTCIDLVPPVYSGATRYGLCL